MFPERGNPLRLCSPGSSRSSLRSRGRGPYGDRPSGSMLRPGPMSDPSRPRTATARKRRPGRSRTREALALLGLLCLVGACGGSDAGPKVRHIILVTLDTTRADHLGCYGNPAVQTPALDQLASEGVRFASCSSAASTTLASHASIMTGTYPHRHGVPRNGFTLSERALTLAAPASSQLIMVGS